MKPSPIAFVCLWICLFVGTSLRAAEPPKAGPISPDKWKSVPCVKGHLATDADVKAGRAVFVISGSDAAKIRPFDLSLPHCALWNDTERMEVVPVVCIQAEEKDGKKIVGFRLLKGGLGMALLSELTLLDAPDARFLPH